MTNYTLMGMVGVTWLMFRPHCLHSVHKIRSIATDGVVWSLCLSLGYICELCKNGCTVWHASCRVDSDGPKEPCIRWGVEKPHECSILAMLRVVWTTYKHWCGNLCSKRQAGTASGCSGPYWSGVTLHCPPPLQYCILSKFFDQLFKFWDPNEIFVSSDFV